MKFYVHVENVRTDVTFAFKVLSSSTTIKDINQICGMELTTMFPNESFTNGRLFQYKKKQSISESLFVMDVLLNKEDVYFRLMPSSCDQVCKSSLPEKTVLEDQHSDTEQSESLSKDQLLKQGRQLQGSGNHHQALLLYKNWLLRRTSADVWNEIVMIYLKAERYHLGFQNAEHGLKLHPNDKSLNLSYMECLLNIDPNEALIVIMKYSKKLRSLGAADREMKHELQMLMCRSYQKLDKRDMAIVLVQGVLREDETNEKARLEFAKLTFDLGEEQAVQSLSILLAALAKDKDNRMIKEYLTEVCKKHKGMKCLQRVLGDTWNSVAALILLANVFRDNGALELSLELLQKALTLEPSNPNVILNYIHLLEVLNKPDEAIKKVKDFTLSKCDCLVFQQTSAYIRDVMKSLPSHVYLCENENSSLTLPQMLGPPSSYSSDDLITLAVWFTIVKILYFQGALTVLPQLCETLDPYHESKGLHQTEIRNEAAYFSCIKKVIQEWLQIPKLKSQKFVYIIGDSHCITPAWQKITYKNESYCTHPILSTGTKIWHLRPGCSFYPNANFYNVLSVVPDKVTVIMIFGEIDCREAIVQCVEKCIYDSLQEAVDHVISIYISLLKELQRKHRWKIFVHPVPPVLDVTRNIVTLFNSRLRTAFGGLQSSEIHYLDGITKTILTEDGTRVKIQYNFDGTHLHPRYFELVEQRLQQF